MRQLAARPLHAPRIRPRGLVFATLLVALVGCAPKQGADEATEKVATEDDPVVADTDDTPARVTADGETTVAAVLEPRLASGVLAPVHAHADAGRWAEAAEKARAMLEGEEELEDDVRDALLLYRGLGLLLGDELGEAQSVLETLAGRESPLAVYGSVLAAEAAVTSKQPAQALALVADVDPGPVLEPRAAAVSGRARLQQGDAEQAVRLLTESAEKLDGAAERRALLALAEAQQALGELQAAVDAYRKVVAASAGSDEANLARAAIEALEPKLQPTEDETPSRDPMTIARRHYKRHRSQKAIRSFSRIARKTDREKDPGRWCEATYLIAKSWSKLRKHGTASGYYDEVIEHCTGARRRDALYNAGRAHWNDDARDTAIERFRTLEKEFPKHSLADDALLYVARIQREKDEPKAAIETLRLQVQKYPDGDMAKDAHWLIFQHLYDDEKTLRDAVEYVEEVGDGAGENDLYTRGRLAYFRARALERLGDEKEARAAFEKVVDEVPLSYYAMLALARLMALDADDATQRVAERRARPYDPRRDVMPVRPLDVIETDGFERAIALLRAGFVDWGRAELRALSDDYPDDSDFLWTLAALYSATGAHRDAYRLAARRIDMAGEYFDDPIERARWSLAYPRPWLETVTDEATRQKLPPHVVYAIMREESGFSPAIESWANALGLMQLMKPTAEDMARRLGMPSPSRTDLFDPDVAIPLGAAYLGKLGGDYAMHPTFIVAGYNGGEANINRWLDEFGTRALDMWVEEIPYGQTRNYTKRVLTSLWRYAWLYDAEAPVIAFDPAESAVAAAGVDE